MFNLDLPAPHSDLRPERIFFHLTPLMAPFALSLVHLTLLLNILLNIQTFHLLNYFSFKTQLPQPSSIQSYVFLTFS